jgi:hypothetical protein
MGATQGSTRQISKTAQAVKPKCFRSMNDVTFTKLAGWSLTLVACTRKVPGLKLDRDTDSLSLTFFSCFPSVTPGKFRDGTLCYAMTTFSYSLSDSLVSHVVNGTGVMDRVADIDR